MHLYIFTSSRKKDKVKTLTIFTSSAQRAYNAAVRYFKNVDAKGKPILYQF